MGAEGGISVVRCLQPPVLINDRIGLARQLVGDYFGHSPVVVCAL